MKIALIILSLSDWDGSISATKVAGYFPDAKSCKEEIEYIKAQHKYKLPNKFMCADVEGLPHDTQE